MSIVFEVSNDSRLLQQYFQIREACFRHELGVDSFDGSEDQFDRTGHILIIRDGERCIGGARISGSTPERPQWLPLEEPEFELQTLFPELSQQGYCQWTRLAILPEYRTAEILRRQCLALIQHSAALGYRYAVNVAGLARARLYKKLHSHLGYDYRIYDRIAIPAEPGFSGLQHLLSVASMDPAASTLPCPTERYTARFAA